MDMRAIQRYKRALAPILVFLFGVTALSLTAAAQATQTEEIAISFQIPKVTSKDIIVLYDGKDLYLPFLEVMNLIGAAASVNAEGTVISGNFLSKNQPYEITPGAFKATAGGKEYTMLASEFVFQHRELYLKMSQYQTWFGLQMTFDFSQLRVLLTLDDKFPAYQKLKRQQARDKLSRATAELKNVKMVPAKRDYFSGGVVDWLLSANPVGGGGHYVDLNSGAMVLGGDFSFNATGNTINGFDPNQMNYLWHYAFDPNKYATQAEAGYVYPGGALSRGVRGALVTNRPLVQRTYFQTVNLSGTLQPGWEVELYIDNKLVDFVTADQQGNYNFNVDINYGTSVVTLKKYGPNDEVETEDRQIQVPYNLIPRHTFEYTVSAGQGIASQDAGTHVQANSYYGVSNHITLGGSMDMPLATQNGQIPLYAFEGTYQLLEAITAYSTLSPKYMMQGGINYSALSSLSANASVTKFDTSSFRNSFKQELNGTFSVSVPFRVKGRYFGSRFFVSYDKYPTFTSIGMNYGFNASISRVYLSYIGQYKTSKYPSYDLKTIASQLFISADFAKLLRPQFRIDYDHSAQQITKYGVYVNHRLFRTGQLTLSYERNPIAQTNSVMLTVNFFNAIANFSSRVLTSDGRTSWNQTQRGSIRYDRIGSSIKFDRRNGVGYGSAVIRPFLDANNDGLVDDSETYLTGLKARISGIGGRPLGRDGLYYYDGLRPYDEYLVQIDATSLDDPTLKPAYDNLKVMVSPNVVTSIDVPVVVASDLSGNVGIESGTGKVGVGGIRLKVLNLSKDIATEISTFNNGDFYYMGLVPGHYRAFVDPQQLSQYGYVSTPESIEFEVKPSQRSSSVEGINFVLSAKK